MKPLQTIFTLITFAGLLSTAPCLTAQEPKAAAPGPNIIFILADDLGWADLGCYDSTFHETPHLDALAREGMRFTGAYAACQVCSPTRAAFQTGKYPARIPITDYIGGARKGKLLPATYLNHLPLEDVTIADRLREAGYRTGHVGKWHLGEDGFYPDKHGYDEALAVGGGSPKGYFAPFRNKNIADGPQGEYLTDRLTDEAIKFIDKQSEKPFFLNLCHHAVHTPLQAKPALVERFKAKAASLPAPREEFITERATPVRQVQNNPVYAAMLYSLDESVGRIMKRLQEKGIADRTVVIFTSDNGGLSTKNEGAPTSNLPLRAGKGWPYEGGIRVPLIVRWPGATPAGAISGAAVQTVDFYPTFLEAADLPLVAGLDGASMLGELRGQGFPARTLFWHYPHYGNQGGAPCGIVREDQWKLIEWYEDGALELYNLTGDRAEQSNMAGTSPDKARELQAKLAAWRQQIHARMPAPNPDYDPNAPQPGRKRKAQAPEQKSGSVE